MRLYDDFSNLYTIVKEPIQSTLKVKKKMLTSSVICWRHDNDVTYDNIKIKKKPALSLSVEDTFLEKPQRVGGSSAF